MQGILLNCGMTPSSALEVDKGLDVSTGYACAGCKDHLSCPLIIKKHECRREAGPVNPGADLCSLQPGSIMLRKCQASLPPKGTIGHLLLSAALGPEHGQCDLSASVWLWDSPAPPLFMSCEGEGVQKQTVTSDRSGGRLPWPRPDHRCLHTGAFTCGKCSTLLVSCPLLLALFYFF